jgi:pseudaminic acid cytidylyltransferase
MKNVLAVIPARGGSKRIPRKNIKNFLGRPIMGYSIDAAKKSGVFEEVMVSTEDKEIAKIAEKLGASVPFMRSEKTAGSKASLADVLLEVLDEYEKRGKKFEYVCFILSTAPFVTAKRIKEGFELLKKTKSDEVIPVVQFSFPIQRAFKVLDNRVKMIWPKNMFKHSQDLMPTYHDSGQYYWLKIESFKKQKKFFLAKATPLILPESEVQDIDTDEDWKIAEMKFKILKHA